MGNSHDNPIPSKSENSIRGSSSFDVPVWLTIVGLVAAGVFAFAHLQARVEQLDQKTIEKAKDDAISEIGKLPTSAQIPIGTIIASVLDPDTFEKRYGDQWMPAAGGDITDTPLASATRQAVAPDLRGLFLRGLNVGRDDQYSDPDKERTPFTPPQMDELKSHQHPFSDSAAGQDPAADNRIQKGDWWPGRVAATKKTELTGGSETRPKNAAVYYYRVLATLERV